MFYDLNDWREDGNDNNTSDDRQEILIDVGHDRSEKVANQGDACAPRESAQDIEFYERGIRHAAHTR